MDSTDLPATTRARLSGAQNTHQRPLNSLIVGRNRNRVLAALLLISLIAVPVIAGAGARAHRLSLSDGKTVVIDRQNNEFAQINVPTETVEGTIASDMITETTDVVQGGSVALAYDTTTRTLIPINTSMLTLGEPATFDDPSIEIGIIDDKTVVSEGKAGRISMLDSASLAPLGAAINVGSAIEDSTVDNAGVLQVLSSDGQLVTVSSDASNTLRVSRRVKVTDDTTGAKLVSTGDETAIVERGRVTFVRDGLVTSKTDIAFDAAVRVPSQAINDAPVPVLVPSTGTVVLVSSGGANKSIDLGDTNGFNADPVVFNKRIYLRNDRTREMLVLDVDGNEIQRLAIPGSGKIDVTLDDGKLWINPANSSSFLIVQPDGRVDTKVRPAGDGLGKGLGTTNLPGGGVVPPPTSPTTAAPNVSTTMPSRGVTTTPTPTTAPPTTAAPSAPTVATAPTVASTTTPTPSTIQVTSTTRAALRSANETTTTAAPSTTSPISTNPTTASTTATVQSTVVTPTFATTTTTRQERRNPNDDDDDDENDRPTTTAAPPPVRLAPTVATTAAPRVSGNSSPTESTTSTIAAVTATTRNESRQSATTTSSPAAPNAPTTSATASSTPTQGRLSGTSTTVVTNAATSTSPSITTTSAASPASTSSTLTTTGSPPATPTTSPTTPTTPTTQGRATTSVRPNVATSIATTTIATTTPTTAASTTTAMATSTTATATTTPATTTAATTTTTRASTTTAATTTTRPPLAPPGAPRNPSWTYDHPTFRLSWSEPSSGDVTSYRVTTSFGDQFTTVSTFVATTAPNSVSSGSFFFQVEAIGPGGSSPIVASDDRPFSRNPGGTTTTVAPTTTTTTSPPVTTTTLAPTTTAGTTTTAPPPSTAAPTTTLTPTTLAPATTLEPTTTLAPTTLAPTTTLEPTTTLPPSTTTTTTEPPTIPTTTRLRPDPNPCRPNQQNCRIP